MNGQFLNPKYERRKGQRRKITLTALIISLTIIGFSALYNIDLLIRSTMLPSSTPIASISEQSIHEYEIHFLGNQFTVNVTPFIDFANTMTQLKNTPTAPTRIYHQLKAFIRFDIPPNLGGDLDEVHKW